MSNPKALDVYVVKSASSNDRIYVHIGEEAYFTPRYWYEHIKPPNFLERLFRISYLDKVEKSVQRARKYLEKMKKDSQPLLMESQRDDIVELYNTKNNLKFIELREQLKGESK